MVCSTAPHWVSLAESRTVPRMAWSKVWHWALWTASFGVAHWELYLGYDSAAWMVLPRAWRWVQHSCLATPMAKQTAWPTDVGSVLPMAFEWEFGWATRWARHWAWRMARR
jgi:hypothetical protein